MTAGVPGRNANPGKPSILIEALVFSQIFQTFVGLLPPVDQKSSALFRCVFTDVPKTQVSTELYTIISTQNYRKYHNGHKNKSKYVYC